MNKKTKSICLIAIIVISVAVIMAVALKIIQYEREGEKKMIFSVNKIICVSTANVEEQVAESNATWAFDITQVNDVYISIENNKENNKKNEQIKSVKIDNIVITEGPKKGKIEAFMPNSGDDLKFLYSDEYKITQGLTYRGSAESNLKTLQINQNGGVIALSFANTGIEDFVSSSETEINYDGRILAKMGISDEDLKFNATFDLIIELTNGKKYCGKYSLDFGCENLVENGTSNIEITDFNNVIFKRI